MATPTCRVFDGVLDERGDCSSQSSFSAVGSLLFEGRRAERGQWSLSACLREVNRLSV
jgi:hypothetical protein